MKIEMTTPIVDFVQRYNSKNPIRLHMPGHKGKSYLGFEQLDITEIMGADNLYSSNSDGIIRESENHASRMFGTSRTMYSTGGSTQCIGAMLYIAMINSENSSKTIISGRNSHKAFVEACGLLDLHPTWIYGNKSHLCSCNITSEELDDTLKSLEEKPIAVYVTSPDYLGNTLDIEKLSSVCKMHKVPLLVDNAHGAYLHFLPKDSKHPIALGANMCCDSAHKTLPVVTGGAYLHFGHGMASDWAVDGKKAMSLFGSTSPSYLILQSLDNCNKILDKNYKQQLEFSIQYIDTLKEYLKKNFIPVMDTEPLKLVIDCKKVGVWGGNLEDYFKKANIEPEWIDGQYIVFMFTPENTEDDYIKLQEFLYDLLWTNKDKIEVDTNASAELYMPSLVNETALTIREALMSKGERIHISRARNRVCQTATVSCPPAVPIVVSGEIITTEHIQAFLHYNVQYIDVIEVKPLDLKPVQGLINKYKKLDK